VPFSGDAANAVTSDITLDDGATAARAQQPLRRDAASEPRGLLAGDAAQRLGIIGPGARWLASVAVYSGDRARLQEKWTTARSAPTPQITVGYEGYRTIR